MATAAMGHHRKPSGDEKFTPSSAQSQVTPPQQLTTEQPTAIRTYLNNMATSIKGIALVRIFNLDHYIRTPQICRDGLNWADQKVRNFSFFSKANAEEVIPPPVFENTNATAGIFQRGLEKLTNAKDGISKLGHSVASHFVENRQWYGVALGFAATYHAVNQLASKRIHNDYNRAIVSFVFTGVAVWTAAVYALKQETGFIDVVETGALVLGAAKAIQYGAPLLKAGLSKLPNPLGLCRRAEKVKAT